MGAWRTGKDMIGVTELAYSSLERGLYGNRELNLQIPLSRISRNEEWTANFKFFKSPKERSTVVIS